MKALLIVLTLGMTACGTDEPENKTTTESPQQAATLLKPEYDQNCLAGKPSTPTAKLLTLCKKVPEGDTVDYTVNLGVPTVTPVSCELVYPNTGMILTMGEMGFTEC